MILSALHTATRDYIRNVWMLCFLFAFANALAQPKSDPKKIQEQENKQKLANEEARLRKKASAENSGKGYYNLSRNIHEQKQVTESKFLLAEALEKAESKDEKHRIFHNLGNVMMKEKKYQEAVDAYKNALRNNPNDEQTRYNYALAKQMLDKNPPPPSDGDNDKNQNKDQQNQDQNKNNDKNQEQDQDKNQDKDDKKDKNDKQNPKDSEKPEEGKDQQQQQPQQGKNRENIERILEAINNEEKKVQDKIKAQQIKGQPVRREKEW